MNIVLIGAQGSGKGTQGEMLAKRFHLKQLSSGDLLRAAIAQGTPAGLAAKPYYDRGELVPDEIVVRMILESIEQLGGEQGILLDGFPRTQAQARVLDERLAERGETINQAIYLDAPRALLLDRLSDRYVCQAKGHTYNLKTNPPRTPGLCDIDGSPLSRRNDDVGEAITRRLDIFFNETIFVVDYYRSEGKLLTVNAARSIKEVQQEILEGLAIAGYDPVAAASREDWRSGK